jgi:hypothetical protein
VGLDAISGRNKLLGSITELRFEGLLVQVHRFHASTAGDRERTNTSEFLKRYPNPTSSGAANDFTRIGTENTRTDTRAHSFARNFVHVIRMWNFALKHST